MINNIYFATICIVLVYLFWIYLGIRWYAHLNGKYNKNVKINEWPLFQKKLIYGGFIAAVNYFILGLITYLNCDDNNLTFFAWFLIVISCILDVAQFYFLFKKYENAN